MKRRFTVVAIGLLLMFFTGCTCGQNLEICSEGIHVVVKSTSGGEFPPDDFYSISWNLDKSEGTVSSQDYKQFWYQPETLTFDIPWTDTDIDQIVVAFYRNSSMVGTAHTQELEWVTTICNPAGGGPQCDDNSNTVVNAEVTFVIDFPNADSGE